MKIDFKKFLFENLGIRQTIFKNTLWLTLGEAVSQFLRLILIIYVARALGATEYGKFTFALAFIALFSVFADLGISQIATREFSQDKEKEKDFSAVLSLKSILTFLTFLIILTGSFFITSDVTIRKIIWILAVFTLLNSSSGTIWNFFEARQKMEYESISKIFQSLLITAFGLFVVFNIPSVQNLSWGYLLAGLIALVFLLIFFHFKVSRLDISWDTSIWLKFLSKSWPLAVASFFSAIYAQVNSVMMGYWGQITQTGLYNAAYTIITSILLVCAIVSQSFFPALNSALRESKEKLQKIWDYFTETTIFLAIPAMVGGIALAPRIIDFIYDPRYFPSILALRILLFTAGFTFLANPFINILVVSDNQKKLLGITLAGAFTNVILNLVLIPKYNLYGAALTSAISTFVVLILLFRTTLKMNLVQPFDLQFLGTLTITLLASFFMYLVISWPKIYSLNVVLAIPIGAAIYFFFFFIVKITASKVLR